MKYSLEEGKLISDTVEISGKSVSVSIDMLSVHCFMLGGKEDFKVDFQFIIDGRPSKFFKGRSTVINLDDVWKDLEGEL